MDKIILFSYDQGNLLIRMLIAHVLTDFLLQTSKMVQNKSWTSKHMMLHTCVVGITNFCLTFSWQLTLPILLSHWLIDSAKCSLQSRFTQKQAHLFFADQLAHLASIIIVWMLYIQAEPQVWQAILFPFTHYQTSLIILGYLLVMWPAGYALQFALHNITKTKQPTDETKVEHGGKLIGLFERVIILTFVLLGAYEAIGFLITGKSIIRFAQQNENLRSEYVLVGTMMSYAIAILVGVLINQFL